jgi:hypothetical protein
MKYFFRAISYLLLLVFSSMLMTGCFYKQPVRHLTSEVSLVVPHQSTQKEIISFMGFPEKKRKISETEEEWLYFQTNKSLLRRTPLLGTKIGYEEYDVAIIRFSNAIVTSSQYRSLTQEEFKQLGIAESAQK